MPEPFELRNETGIRLQFSAAGNLQAIRHESVLINQVIPLAFEDSLMRLVVRLKGAARRIIPLTGTMADTTQRQVSANSVTWEGHAEGLDYKTSVVLHARLPAWYWRVQLRNGSKTSMKLDVLYGQDLGLAHVNAVTNNEAYVCQYIDHLPVETNSLGTVILSRQNQAQSGNRFPWIAQGCLDGAAAYGTDGFQFFGKQHRETGVPAAWDNDLPSQRLQYEFAYIGLQSREVQLSPGEERTITFFASYAPDHPKASAAEDVSKIIEQISHPPEPAGGRSELPSTSSATIFSTAPPVAGETLSEGECHELFPGAWRNVEERDSALHSFFHGEGRHVVLRAKEGAVERPHGHLLRSGDALWPEENVLGTTVYATGIFNAQVFLGNTNLARFLSVVRNALNVTRVSGQRVFVKLEGEWRQLGVPSAFEIGLHDARWIYRLGERVIEAQTWCWSDRPAATLELRVRGGGPLEFLVSHHLALGNDESPPGNISFDASAGAVSALPAVESLMHKHMPGVGLAIVTSDPTKIARVGGGELLGASEFLGSAPLAVVQTIAVSQCSITLAPFKPGEKSLGDFASEIRTSLGQGKLAAPPLPLEDFRLEHASDERVTRVSEAVPWFVHNAANHLATPHGLEQYGGAAWGVRDVCQGPVEWLLAAGRHAEVRRILLNVFAQQYGDDGSWPQWYMHPPFDFIRQEHSHGDIPFWPLKALCDYVEAANDFSILRERVDYRARPNEASGRPDETIAEHVDRIIGHYRHRCLGTTALINYGDGDWDDTLQPANPALRSTMVSSWTVGLVYHAFRLWREVCLRGGETERAATLAPMLDHIREDFRRLLIIDGQTCGFAIQEGDKLRPLLHPRDTVTGIQQRLLPMTRAILAELFTPEEARHHAELIRQKLLFPDGVRLMSSPVPYRGGVETIFKRAESAANFGREIGLQYVHAHLRYAEAMAKLGDADALWRALQVVNPVKLDALLPNAAPRQSNTYFSSSDGDFADRYEAASGFDRLRDGTVAVKGGWRIYSSGPGLYLHKVVTCLLGWRESFGDVMLDPVIPSGLDGLTARFIRAGKAIEVQFRVRDQSHTPKAIIINETLFTHFRPLEGVYRSSGVALAGAAFDAALDRALNCIRVEL
jgi:CRISPR-associated protein Csx3